MSKKDMVYHIGVDMSANIGDVESKFNKLKSTLASVSLPSSMKKELTETFTRASQELEDFITLQKQSGHTEADVKKINQAYKSVVDSIDILSRKVAGIESLDASKLLPKELNGQIKELNKEIARLSDLSKGQDSVQIREATDAYTVQEQKVAELNKKLKEQEESQTKLAGVKDTTADRAAEAKKHYDELSDTQDKLKTKIGDMTNDDYNKSLEKTTKYHDDLNAKIAKEAELTGKIDALNEKIERKKARRKNTKEGTKERKDLDLDIEFAEKDRDKLVKERGQVRRSKTNLEKSEPEIKSAEKMQKQYEEYTKAAQAVKEFETEVDKTAKTSENAARNYERATATLAKSQSNYDAAQKELDELSDDLKELEDASGNLDAPLQKVRVALANLKGVDISEIPSDIGQLQGVLDNLVNDQMNRVQAEVRELRTDLDSTDDSTERLGNDLRDNFTKTAESMFSAQKQMEQLSQSMLHFFSLTNGWQLLKRAIREAFETVKELDAAMTEIAVVSDYTVDEIWAMREQYSAAATQMGAKTIDLVNATKLYVQQGLSLNEAMEVGIETTKMARIANLDGAEATNLMTAALRGFNMEMEEANRVNDTYSQLAAKSAADTQEIAVAMSKTASIAANAGSSFENMSAFLTQIIETTREAPETAGTAMKTIIARFQELKKPMSEIGEVDGEIVDANGIETALRSAGVQLRDTNGEFRDFDEVIIELAGKWNSLDVMTQRYIATMAAGSRQQSRFIALMSDNARLTELVSYANNSAGAANQQYEKTLESLEAKLNKLKNAVDIFWTNLANNEIIKFAVDLLTKVIETVNSLTSAFTQSKNGFMNFIGSLLQIGMAAGAFKLQQNAILGIFSKISAVSFGAGKKAGEQYSAGFGAGINTGAAQEKGAKKLFTSLFKTKGKQDAIVRAKDVATLEAYNKKTLAAAQAVDEYGKDSSEAAIAMKAKTMAEQAATTQTGLNGDQLMRYNTLVSQGMGAEAAYLQVRREANAVDGEAYIQTMMNAGMTREEAQAKWNKIVADEQETDAEARLNAQKSMGLKTRFSLLWQIITGNKQKAIDIMTTYGLITAEQADTLAKGGQTGAQWALNAATYAFPGVWLIAIILAIIAVVALLVVGIMQLCGAFDKTETASQRLKRLQKETENARKAADKAAEAYENLCSQIDELSEGYQTLEDLTHGTAEWRQELNRVNNQVLALLDSYPELAQYISNVDGMLVIDDEGLVLVREQAAEIQQDTEVAQIQAKQYELQAQKRADGEVLMNDIQKRITEEIEYTGTDQDAADQATAQIQKYVDVLEKHGLKVETSSDGYVDGTSYSMGVRDITGEFEDLDLEALKEDFKDLGLDMASAFELAIDKYTKANLQQVQVSTQAVFGMLNDKNAASEFGASVSEHASQYFLSDKYENRVDGQVKRYLGDDYGTKGTNNSTDKLKQLMKDEGIGGKITGTAKDDIRILYKHMSGQTDEDIKGVGGEELARRVEQIIISREFGPVVNEAVERLDSIAVRDKGRQSRLNAAMGADVSEVKLSDIDDLEWTNATLEEIAAIYGKTVEELATFRGMTVEEMRKELEEKAAAARIEEAEAVKKFNKLNFTNGQSNMLQSIQKELSIQQFQDLADALFSVQTQYGVEGVSQISDVWRNMLYQVSTDQRDAFINAFNSIDFLNLKSFFDFQSTLDSLDITLPESEMQELYELMKELGAVTLMTSDAFNSALKNINGVFQELKTGMADAVYTAEEYAAIIQAVPEAANDFTIDLNGDYVYLGNHMNDLRDAVKNNTQAIISQNLDNLKGKIEIGDIQKQFSIKNDSSEEKGEDLAFGASKGGVTDTEKAQLVQAFLQEYPELDLSSIGYGNVTWEQLEGQTDEIAKIYSAILSTIQNYGVNVTEYDKYTTDSTILNYQLKEITDLSLMRSATMSSDKNASKNIYTAFKAKARTANIPETLISQYIDAYEAQDWKALEKIEKNIAEMINRDAAYEKFNTMSEAFSEAVENQEKIEDIQLRILKVQDMFDEFGIRVNAKNVDSLLALADAMTKGDYSAYIQALQLSTGVAGYMTHLTVGQTGGITTQQQQLSLQDDSWLDQMYATSQLVLTETIFNASDVGKIARIINEKGEEVWTVITSSMINSAGAIVSAQTESFFSSAMVEDKEEQINSYDWLYNLNARINKVLRERNKLEEEENRILEARGPLMTETLLNNLETQYVNLLTTLSAYEELQNQRINGKGQVYSELELYNNSLSKLGLNKYMGFNNGVFEINHKKIDKASSEDKELIDQYISEGEYLQEQINDIEDGVEETNDKLRELRTKYTESTVDLENALIDAIVELREKEIEAMEEMNDEITNGNEKLLDRIQDSVDKMRKDRENEKSLEEINDMERRLALMRTDTSGANALDILSLEEDLEEARQAYQDTLIDQAIDEMTRQNEQAAEQRQKQIDMMKQQLDADKEYGDIAKQVNDLLSGELTSTKEGTIKALLSAVGGANSLGSFGQSEYMKEIQNQVSAGIAGIIYNSQGKQDEQVQFTDVRGNTVSGQVQADGTVVDAQGNRYTGVYKDSNNVWRQHYTGEVFSQTEWDKKIKGITDNLNLGKTDLVEVEEASSVSIKAGTVNLSGTIKGSAGSSGFTGETSTDAMNYLNYKQKTQTVEQMKNYKARTGLSYENLRDSLGFKDWDSFISSSISNEGNLTKAINTQILTSEQAAINGSRELMNWIHQAAEDKVISQDYDRALQQYRENTRDYDGQYLWYRINQQILSDNTGVGQIANFILKGQLQPDELAQLRGSEPTTPTNHKKPLRDIKRGELLEGPISPFATGGLADFTGPAWLDGTKSRPEYVLNAAQTQGFLSLVDILDNFDADKTKKGSGDNYYDVHIEVDEISNDYDVEQLMEKMKRIIADDAMYRNVNAVDLGRR